MGRQLDRYRALEAMAYMAWLCVDSQQVRTESIHSMAKVDPLSTSNKARTSTTGKSQRTHSIIHRIYSQEAVMEVLESVKPLAKVIRSDYRTI